MSDFMLKPQVLERFIYQAAYNFTRNTGKRPIYLYLGHDEFHTWRTIVKNYAMFSVAAARGEGGLEWNGMQVLEVNIKSHVGVGLL